MDVGVGDRISDKATSVGFSYFTSVHCKSPIPSVGL